MRKFKFFVSLTAFIIFCAILYGFSFASFKEEGKELLSLSWGVITLIDIYIMFSLFCLWVVFREGVNLKSFLIVILVMLLGSLTASLYTLYALQKSKGSWKSFWLGTKNY